MKIELVVFIRYKLIYWSALAPTPAQLQLGAKEAINSMEMLPFAFFFGLQP